MQTQIQRARDAIAKDSIGLRRAVRAIPCPNCDDGLLYYALRRCGSISAACSCPGGVIIDDITLEEAMARANDIARNRPPTDWLSKSQPPE